MDRARECARSYHLRNLHVAGNLVRRVLHVDSTTPCAQGKRLGHSKRCNLLIELTPATVADMGRSREACYTEPHT